MLPSSSKALVVWLDWLQKEVFDKDQNKYINVITRTIREEQIL